LIAMLLILLRNILDKPGSESGMARTDVIAEGVCVGREGALSIQLYNSDK